MSWRRIGVVLPPPDSHPYYGSAYSRPVLLACEFPSKGVRVMFQSFVYHYAGGGWTHATLDRGPHPDDYKREFELFYGEPVAWMELPKWP